MRGVAPALSAFVIWLLDCANVLFFCCSSFVATPASAFALSNEFGRGASVLDLTGLDDKEVRTVIQCDGGGGGMARALSHSHRVQVRVRFVGGREGELVHHRHALRTRCFHIPNRLTLTPPNPYAALHTHVAPTLHYCDTSNVSARHFEGI